MADAAQALNLEPGDFYEDCRYHPMVCIGLGEDGDELEGISLVTGDVGSCSLNHCGIVKLTAAEAIQRRLHWDEFVEEHGLADYSSSRYPRGNPPRSVG